MRKFPLKRKVHYLTFALMLLMLTLPKTAFSQASTTTIKEFFPVVISEFVPCANSGAGELVVVSGTFSVHTHLVVNDNRVIGKFHNQLQGATGQGLITGDVYRFVRVIPRGQNFAINRDGSFSFTAVNIFMFIGPGPDNNLILRQNFHSQVNANGDVTSNVENISADCK